MLIAAVAMGFGAPASVTIYNWVILGGVDWSSSDPIPPWLIPLGISLLGAFLLFNHFNREFVAAGAGWVAHNSGWVRTYELVQIKIEVDLKPFVVLVDRDLRAMRLPLTELQQNRDLWDLVHNGILHSFREQHVHTNPLARSMLGLHGPAIRNELRLQREGPRPDELVVVDRARWWRPTRRRYRRGQRQ